MKKADNFNPGQWLVENKLTNQSKLNEMPIIVNPVLDPLTKIIKSKIKDLETQMVDGVLHVDFDEIGDLWMTIFEEVFGHEFEDNIDNVDEDYDNFAKIQNITRDLLSNNGEIEIEFDY